MTPSDNCFLSHHILSTLNCTYTHHSQHKNTSIFNNHTTISDYSPLCSTHTNNYNAWFSFTYRGQFFFHSSNHHTHVTDNPGFQPDTIAFHPLFMLSPTQFLCCLPTYFGIHFLCYHQPNSFVVCLWVIPHYPITLVSLCLPYHYWYQIQTLVF